MMNLSRAFREYSKQAAYPEWSRAISTHLYTQSDCRFVVRCLIGGWFLSLLTSARASLLGQASQQRKLFFFLCPSYPPLGQEQNLPFVLTRIREWWLLRPCLVATPVTLFKETVLEVAWSNLTVKQCGTIKLGSGPSVFHANLVVRFWRTTLWMSY